MKFLVKSAFLNRQLRRLLAFIIISMVLLTFASQLEMLALGVITKKGPDLFELFAPEVDGVLQRTDVIDREQVNRRWEEISKGSEALTENDAIQYLATHSSEDRIQSAIHFINRYIPISGNIGNLALLFMFIALYKALALFAYRYSTKNLAIKVSRDLRQQYFDHIQLLSMDFYQKYNIGSISSRVVSDTFAVGEAINAALMNYIQTPFTAVTTMALCFITSWKLSLIIFLGFPIILLPINYISKNVRRLTKQLQQRQEKFASVLVDFLAGVMTVKVFGMEEVSRNKYWEHNQKIADLEKRGARYDLSSRPVVHTIAVSFLALCMLFGLYVLDMSISEAFFFCGLLHVFYEPIKKFAEQNGQIQRGLAASERMQEIMALQPQVTDAANAAPLTSFTYSIEFDRVGFRYSDRDWVLRDLSFQVKKGQSVAIVGPTGAGKSTLAQLIPRLYDVQEGEIRIDGKPLKSYTQKSLRFQIGFVPQKAFLFLDTIADNIAFGQNLSQQEIEEAAIRAHAHEFIVKFPKEYATELSEAGSNLSGGQQQRLAIARALAKKAPILIMDEATSSLDVLSEKRIKEALKVLKGEITQIIIAHRLSTIEDADLIIFLQDGRKIAEGTKNELLKNCPEFQRMWLELHKKEVLP